MTTWKTNDPWRSSAWHVLCLCCLLSAFISGCLLLPNRVATYPVTIDDADSVGFRNKKMPIKEFSSSIKQNRPASPVTEFVFACADETRHESLLRVQRILSLHGFWRFSLAVGKRRIPLQFGPSFDVSFWLLPKHVERIYVTAHLVAINKQHKFPVENMGGDCERMIKEAIRKGNDIDSAVDITCEMKSLNGTLKKILSFVPETYCGRIFVSSMWGDDVDRWVTDREYDPREKKQ